jgi:hypothetical protein
MLLVVVMLLLCCLLVVLMVMLLMLLLVLLVLVLVVATLVSMGRCFAEPDEVMGMARRIYGVQNNKKWREEIDSRKGERKVSYW